MDNFPQYGILRMIQGKDQTAMSEVGTDNSSKGF